MPYYQTVTYTTTGTKDSINLDPSIAPFNSSVAATLTAGTTSYKIQYSLSPMTVADASALWFDSVDFPAATTASAVAALPFPVSRLRIVIAALSGGNIVLQILQGMSTN